MRKNVVSVVTAIALVLCAESPGTAANGTARQAIVRTWLCTTTSANVAPASATPAPNATPESGGPVGERDTWERIGRWTHGTARPLNGVPPGPDYDYYLGRVGSEQIYIQIDPANGTYFVGSSRDRALNGSHWKIVFPYGEGRYTFSGSRHGFAIVYADLTQACNEGPTSIVSPPTAELQCDTYSTGDTIPHREYLSIAQLAPNWWQGVALDRPMGGRVVYEYNIFTIGSERVSVEVNALEGTYAIATSHAPALSDSVWTVVYPNVENGFRFTNVVYSTAGTLQSFTLVFRDGYQNCYPLE
ncbi:MAG TPA: hypothetical protein VIN40_10445 [Candidatus Tyrphobacter sp.]